jgi:hypothetical protein
LTLPNGTLEDLAERFATCRIPKSEWTHHAHLAVGMWHVHTYGAADALVRLRDGIKRLNDSHGTPNNDTRGYHETITRAYVQILTQVLGSYTGPLDECVSRVLAGPLAAHDLLLAFYSRETLMSVRARKDWVEPDIVPIDIDALTTRP